MMDEKTTARLVTELARYAGELLPGGAERIAKEWHGDIPGEPGRLARAVHEAVRSPHAARYRRLGVDPVKDEPDPLRAALARRAGDLRPKSADALYDAWALELARLPAAEIAEQVGRRLSDARNNEHLKSPNPPSPSATRIAAALKFYVEAGIVRSGYVEELAMLMERDLDGITDPRILDYRIRARLTWSDALPFIRSGVAFDARTAPRPLFDRTPVVGTTRKLASL